MFFRPLFITLLTFAGLVSAYAEDTKPSEPKPAAAKTAASPLDKARALIKNQQWTQAIVELKTLSPNADVYNLLGFSSRKNGQLKEAFAYYDKALSLDPAHKGALEYQGEAFLMAKQPAQAQTNLARLKTLCGGTQCEEYQDLEAAIKKHL